MSEPLNASWVPSTVKVLALVTQSFLTLQPHELQPAGLLCPWDSQGKNTGVGCHFLLWDLPDPGIEPRSPALQADSLPSMPPGNQAERPPNPLVTVEDPASILLVLGPFQVPKSITARFYRRNFRKAFLMSKDVITLHFRPRHPHPHPPAPWTHPASLRGRRRRSSRNPLTPDTCRRFCRARGHTGPAPPHMWPLGGRGRTVSAPGALAGGQRPGHVLTEATAATVNGWI